MCRYSLLIGCIHECRTLNAICTSTTCEGNNLQSQAVAYLVKENTGGDAVTAQYAIRSHTWSESAADAMNSSTALYSLLGPGGNQTWDYVILQACRLNHTRSSRNY